MERRREREENSVQKKVDLEVEETIIQPEEPKVDSLQMEEPEEVDKKIKKTFFRWIKSRCSYIIRKCCCCCK